MSGTTAWHIYHEVPYHIIIKMAALELKLLFWNCTPTCRTIWNSSRGLYTRSLYVTIVLPCPALPGLSLWRLGLGEMVATGTRDLCAIRTATKCTVYVKHAKCRVVLVLCCPAHACTGYGPG